MGLTVNSLEFRAVYRDTVTFGHFTVLMGSVAGDELSAVFDDNSSGGMTTVFTGFDALFHADGGWVEIPLDQAHTFHGDAGLLIEIVYSGANHGQIYCGNSDAPNVRTLYSPDPESPGGTVLFVSPHLRLKGTAAFSPDFSGTFPLTLIRLSL